jgi:hypothetical protein
LQNDPWSKFDASVIIVSWLAVLLEARSMQVIRALRCCRIIFVLKSAKRLRSIAQVLLVSIYPALNIAQLLALLFALYGILGMQIFGNAPLQDLECLVKDGYEAEFCHAGEYRGTGLSHLIIITIP